MSIIGKIRKWHNKLVLFCAIQFMVWIFSGLYMVVMDIDFIHGDHLVKPDKQLSNPINFDSVKVSFADINRQYPHANSITLTTRLSSQASIAQSANPSSSQSNQQRVNLTPQLAEQRSANNANISTSSILKFDAVYHIKLEAQSVMILAKSNAPVEPLLQHQVEQLSQYYYHGQSRIAHSQLITEYPPQEFGARALPVWQVNFYDQYNSRFYIDPLTGQLLTKRHTYWQIFDLMWRGHIMDYDDGKNVANWLLMVFSISALLSILTGGSLVYFNYQTYFKRMFLGVRT